MTHMTDRTGAFGFRLHAPGSIRKHGATLHRLTCTD